MVVERELAKRKVHIAVGISRVQDRWLNQRGAATGPAGVEHELEFLVALAEPDASAGDARDGDDGWVRAWRDGDGAVDWERLEDFSWWRRGREEACSTVGLDEDAGHRRDGEAGDVGMDGNVRGWRGVNEMYC